MTSYNGWCHLYVGGSTERGAMKITTGVVYLESRYRDSEESHCGLRTSRIGAKLPPAMLEPFLVAKNRKVYDAQWIQRLQCLRLLPDKFFTTGIVQ